MRRIIVLILAIMLLTITVVACGNDEPEIEEITPLPLPEPVAEEVQEPEPEPIPEPEPEEEFDDNGYGAAYVDDYIEEPEPIDPDALAPLGDFRFGTIDGNTFESEWLGLRVVVSDNYNMQQTEEVLGLDSLSVEVLELEGEELAEALSEVWNIAQMLSRQFDDNSAISIWIDRQLLTRDMTIEQWIEAFIEQMEIDGWTLEHHDNLERVERWGSEWYTFSANDSVWTYLYFIQRIDNKMVYIQIGAVDATRHQEMLEFISEF